MAIKSLTFQLPVMPTGIHLVLACPATIIAMYYIGTGNNGSKDILFEAEFVDVSFFNIILSFDIAPFPYKHAQRGITFIVRG